MVMALVAGATGKAGRETMTALLRRDVRVRAMVRDRDRAHLPAEVETVEGDLSRPVDLERAADGADYAFLLSGAMTPESAAAIGAAPIRRTVLLWAGYRGPVEDALAASGTEWVGLEPVSFLGNTLTWASGVRDGSTVVEPFVDVAESMVDERDVAEVAAEVMLTDGHAGRRYSLTGAEPVSVRDRVRGLSAALGREVTLRELTEEQARRRWSQEGYDEALIDALVAWQQRPPAEATRVDAAVPDLLGRPAGTFAGWLGRHLDRFRR
ncbi:MULTISPECIES: NAD(P)H-binding protein [unclassified Nocardioides]|uniref:NAD(P)H-binding protein n=1 Tax=unclassified Nocardioides TaxID=2615069 RepID=UPI003609380E